ncbi:phosphotransferase [Thermopolyspora sp. NPDC052614]|uniref:phosphotransferase family protein n=1 Tax=Thermopolyspora sp. NPDC052614 TaxID=3155682 RepID=UPI00342E9B86
MSTWDGPPAEVREAITDRFGPITGVAPMPPGLTAGTSVRLDTPRGRLFIKALPQGSPSVPLYLREAHVTPVLPAVVPSPPLRWSGHHAGWISLVFDHIEPARKIDLGPGSPDGAAAIDLVRLLGEALTPNPAGDVPGVVPGVFDNVRFLCSRADRILAARPADLDGHAVYAAARALLDENALTGGTLLHTDLHEGNLLAGSDRLHLIDWGLAAAGAAWVETALLIPRLILAGHTPEAAEQLAERIPAWKDAPPEAVTGLAAVWSLFREFVARHGPERIRASRARAAAAGRKWLEYRMS